MKRQAKRIMMSLVLLSGSLLSAVHLDAQVKEPRNVAIFLYEGVELLDFAGPGEVFSASGFNVFTMSVEGKPLLSQGFVSVQPQYSMANAPHPDIIVFPGGGSGATSKNQQVMEWISKLNNQGSVFMSVCTGAFVLARANLLNGMNVTTHYGSIEDLQALLPDSKVLEHTRFVDNGTVITTAGVSAGIDGALHLVARIKGTDAAKATAHYMEYDKWDPENGRVDRINHNLAALKVKAEDAAASDKSSKDNFNFSNPLPYEGELLNLSAEYRDKGQYKQSAYILEQAIKVYPGSALFYPQLSYAYRKQGKPAPVEATSLMKMIADGKVDEAIALYDKEKKKFPGWKIVSENEMNDAGYQLLTKKDYTNAVKVFQLNVREYPQSANVYDSLGEAFFYAGNKKEAIVNYQKVLELSPGNQNAILMLERIGQL